ncbi:MAG: amidophosphoribosyltransferase [Acidobacteriota bacterium]
MCGIFAIENHPNAANLTYQGLYALQHRGQESAGMVTWNGTSMNHHREMGEVSDIFDDAHMGRLTGNRAAGHTRYSTAGHSVLANAQPIVVSTSMGPIGVVHNGNLTNATAIRKQLVEKGAIFQTTSDTEVILHLIARNPRQDLIDSVLLALSYIEGAYSLLLVTAQGLIAARDPHGFRPLIWGRLGDTSCFASESCSFDLLGAEVVAELEPGEVMVVRGTEVSRHVVKAAELPARCAFEHVYFARPDSQVYGEMVSTVRTEMGATLAREAWADADVIVPVPDSGLFPALGYSRESGIPFELGLIRNHYVGRTFIQPAQDTRDFGVRMKLNPVRPLIEGRRVVLVDDSIVRGTTSRKIVRMVREADASEVHLRICSPPTRWPCRYGIDTPNRAELIAGNDRPIQDICDFVGADSLEYLSVEGMLACLGDPAPTYCTACWTGNYRVPITDAQHELFPAGRGAES